MDHPDHLPDRNSEPSTAPSRAVDPRSLKGAAPMVLVVSASAARRTSLAGTMERDDLACGIAESVDEARVALTEGATIEAVVVDVPRCTAAALRFVRELGERQIAALLVCPDVSFDDAVEAMRAGAADIVPPAALEKDLSRRVRCAVQQRRAARAAEIRRENTRAALGAGDDLPLPDAVMPLCPDTIPEEYSMDGSFDADPAFGTPPLPAPKRKAARKAVRKTDVRDDPADRTPAAIADQFRVMISGELDVESLLRQVLEFILAHAGATNAAVFLPGNGGDFSLGAYVNYSCPKETAEILLDHLANVAAPNLETSTGVLHLRTAGEIADRFGDGCDWLNDHSMVAFTCRAEGDCLAVFTLFRERSAPFTDETIALLGRLSEVFGTQLGRVVRIHHRHLPRDKWGGLGEPGEPGDEGMAA
ncbi:MAG: hypothetical protein ACT4PL_04320 [Phycisphaerales bacterium]